MGAGANTSRAVGTGGMATKLAAAQIATQAGCEMIIMDGRASAPFSRLENGERSTLFLATTNPKNAKAQWIIGSLKPKGRLRIDTGAVKALKNGKSLLAAGVTNIEGRFQKGDAIGIYDRANLEIARGLSSYDSQDVHQIKGHQSDKIEDILGYTNGPALIHRDNLVMTPNV